LFSFQILFYIFSIILLVFYLFNDTKRLFLTCVFAIFLSTLITTLVDYSNFNLIMLIAIFFSFIGDLMMAEILKITNDRIINGILLFGVAHIFYTIGFITKANADFNYLYPISGTIMVLLMFYLVGYNPKNPNHINIAIIIYASIITILFLTIVNFSLSTNIDESLKIRSLFGIALFIISDSTIAYNQFKSKIKGAEQVISSTYIVSQILLQSIII